MRTIHQSSIETWTTNETGPDAVWQLKERTLKPMKATHYADKITSANPQCVRHTLALKILGRYLIITWVWTR